MIKKPAVGLLLLLLGGGSGTGIYYYLNRKEYVEKTDEEEGIVKEEKSKVKILKLVEGDSLPYENFDAYWEKLVAKIKKDNKEKRIFKGGVNKDKLIQWCKNQKEKEIFEDEKENNKDLNQTKEWCIWTIKEELGEAKALKAKSTDKSEDRESWKVKALILSKYGEEAVKDVDLNGEIKKAQEKAKVTTDSKFWNKLSDWCKDAYQTGFKGEENDIWKLANKFCTKPTNRDMIVWGGLAVLEGKLENEWTSKVTEAESDETVKSIIAQENKKEKLQSWCKDKFKELISSASSDDATDDGSLQRIKKLCVLTNKEKLGQDQITIDDVSGSTDKTTWIGKISNLEAKNELSNDLKEISKKHKDSRENNAWKELRAWCKSIQDKGYVGNEDADFKLAQEICKKS